MKFKRKKINSDSSKFKKVAVMIPYKDGLSILENLEDSDGKLTMTIKKGVSLTRPVQNTFTDLTELPILH